MGGGHGARTVRMQQQPAGRRDWQGHCLPRTPLSMASPPAIPLPGPLSTADPACWLTLPALSHPLPTWQFPVSSEGMAKDELDSLEYQVGG